MFSCKISQIFNNIFFTEHLQWLPVGIGIQNWSIRLDLKLLKLLNPFAIMGVVNDPLYQIWSGDAIFENFTAIFGIETVFDTFGQFSSMKCFSNI